MESRGLNGGSGGLPRRGLATTPQQPPAPLNTNEITELLRRACSSMALDSRNGRGAPSGGDVEPLQAAEAFCRAYSRMTDNEKFCVLVGLGQQCDVNHANLARSASFLTTTTDPKALRRVRALIGQQLHPPLRNLLDRVAGVKDGLAFLIALRVDLLDFYRSRKDVMSPPERAALDTVNLELRERLQSWIVSGGYLDLVNISWTSSAAMLEKVMEYEAVHPFKGWSDLKQRVGPGRRIYGFCHAGLPHQALTSVQVALTDHVPTNIQDILEDKHPGRLSSEETTTAIFYSISTQKGLAGVELGSFLLKRVMTEIKTEFPAVTTSVTLSPIPGFRHWLYRMLNGKDAELSLLGNDWVAKEEAERLMQLSGSASAAESILTLTQSTGWHCDKVATEAIRSPLERLCVFYLALTRTPQGSAVNPVAHFHLRNGACIHRINYLGNTSVRGMEESLGMMVNYRYMPEEVERRNQGYVVNGHVCVERGEGPGRTVLEHICAASPSISMV